jgi:hypothetical protein
LPIGASRWWSASSYEFVPALDNPTNDAKLMADTLQVGGGPQLNLDKAAFDKAVQDFGAKLQGADVSLFYYAGHGVQVRGSNYLVPINANPTREADVDFQMLDAALDAPARGSTSSFSTPAATIPSEGAAFARAPQHVALSRPITPKWVQLIVRSVYPGWKYSDTVISEVRVDVQ